MADITARLKPNGFVRCAGLMIINKPITEITTEMMLVRLNVSCNKIYENKSAKTGLQENKTATVAAGAFSTASWKKVILTITHTNPVSAKSPSAVESAVDVAAKTSLPAVITLIRRLRSAKVEL